MVDAADHSSLTIYICDRGYASYNNFAHVIENGQYFLIRCTGKKTEGILGFSLEGIKEMDFQADRILTRSQSKKKRAHPERAEDYRHVCSAVPMDYLTDDKPEYDISLRVVRVEIAPGSFENLITNLPEHEFDTDNHKEPYHLRRCQENAYRDIKYPLCLKALHSKKYEYAVQEIWARAVLHNFCAEITSNGRLKNMGGNMSIRQIIQKRSRYAGIFSASMMEKAPWMWRG